MEEPAGRSNAQSSSGNHPDKADHDQDTDPDPNRPPTATNHVRHHVLIVQIPKDQIYRYPPPENALIVERHRNPEKKRRDPPCCCCFKSALGICAFVSVILLLVIILVLGLVPSIPSLLLMPADPVFTVDQFSVKNSSSVKTRFEFDVKLKVENKNPAVGILYEDGADVALSSKQMDKVAAAKFPGLALGRGDDKGSVKLAFKGLIGNLPKDMKKSMKSAKPKVAVAFGLNMNLNTRMKVGISNSRVIKFTVWCNFKVDSLKGKARVVSQQCDSKRKIS